MSNLVKTKIRRKTSNKLNGWDSAISAAERQLKQVQQRATQLTAVIKNFKELKQSGVRWPLSNT